MAMLRVCYSCKWRWSLWRLDKGLWRCTLVNPGGARCVLVSPAYALAMDVLGTCGSRAILVWGGSGEVAANVCMMFWNIVVWVLSVSVEASICLSMLRLMLLVSVVNLSSTVSTSSLMVLVNFSNTRGEVAAVLLIAWVF